MKNIAINNEIVIGENKPVFIIAEIGSNHNQSLDIALETIDAAVEAGADAVKFQSLNIEKLYHDPGKDIVDLHKKIDLPEEWHYRLKEYCDQKGIIFFSAPTYLEAVDILEEIGVDLYKIASAQSGTFPQLVKKVAETRKPALISSGIASYSDLERVVRIFENAGNQKYVILHCNSIYPTPTEKVNLNAMNTFSKMFDCNIGYSDHTAGILVPPIAVALGATVIEKHFTLDKKFDVPDAPFSLDPEEFSNMTANIRSAEKLKGTGHRLALETEEERFKDKILYRAFLKSSKSAGDKLKPEDLYYRRYRRGVDCRLINQIIDKPLSCDLAADTLLEFSYFNL